MFQSERLWDFYGQNFDRDLKIFAYHGVNEEEKLTGKIFVFDIDLFVNMTKACYSDDVNDTVS